jgi:hypothetical protein
MCLDHIRLVTMLHEYLPLYIWEHSEYSLGSVSEPFHVAFLVREGFIAVTGLL